MTRQLLVLFIAVAFAAVNSSASANNPEPQAPPESARASKPDPTQDPGIRKLSRRERKERIAKLDEKYRNFLIEVEPIMLPTELNVFLQLETNAQRDLYIEDFWGRRNPNTRSGYNEYRETYQDLLVEAKQKFRNLVSDRSRVYLVRGRPDEIIPTDCSRYLQPIDIWYYSYLEGFGHDVFFLFYKPRIGSDYRLWTPMGMGGPSALEDLEELLSIDGQRLGAARVFLGAGGMSPIQFECNKGDELLGAIFWVQQNRLEVMRAFRPPEVETEDVGGILRATVVATPGAAKLPAELHVRYPGKRGARTSVEVGILVPRASLGTSEVNQQRFFNLDVVGEVLKEGNLFEHYRYRFDYPVDAVGDEVPVLVERFLRPDTYDFRIKLTDVNSGAEAILERKLEVPYIERDAAQASAQREASGTIDRIQEELRVGEPRLRIIPMGEELLRGLQKIETIASPHIKAVDFYLDGKKIMTKRRPPFDLELDFGEMPRMRRIKVVGKDEKENILSGDEVTVNIGLDPFRVRIVTPRVSANVAGSVRVELDVKVPEGKTVKQVELHLNDAKVATLYEPPYIQTIHVPADLGVGYLRAVAILNEAGNNEVEDVVFLNAPQFLEEVDVHLVELPTTVTRGGRVITDLGKDAFRVFDNGAPAEISKFEYVRNLPLSIGMAIDTSGSMKLKIIEAQKAGGQFFKSVLKPGDKAFVLAFDERPMMIEKWTRNLSDLSAGLASLRAEEATALYDALVLGLYNFQGIQGQKALIVISDGKDTASEFSFDQAVEYARRSGVPIYAIGIGLRAGDTDAKHKLNRFAKETGGSVYFIERAVELGRVYGEIEEELRSQYILGIYPPQGVASGSDWREVRVEVRDGKAKTISGYYP